MQITFIISALNGISAIFTPRRVFAYALTFAIISWLILLTVANPRSITTNGVSSYSGGGDFIGFYSTGSIARLSPKHLYDKRIQRAAQLNIIPTLPTSKHVSYFYPPFFAIVLMPLSRLAYVQAYWVWTAASVLFYLASISILTSVLPSAKTWFSYIFLVAISAPALFWCLLLGQTTGFGLFIWTLSFYMMKWESSLLSGFTLGFVSYRFHYFVLIVPILLLKKWWRAIGGLGISSLILLAAGVIAFSLQVYTDYLDALLHYSERRGQNLYPYSMSVSLYGFFRLLGPGQFAITLTLLSDLLLIYLVLQAWKGPINPGTPAFDLKFALLTTVTLLVMHHSMVYDLLLLTIPLLIIFEHRSEFPPYYKIIVALLYFAPFYWFFTGLAGKNWLNVTQPLLIWLTYELYRACKKETNNRKTNPHPLALRFNDEGTQANDALG